MGTPYRPPRASLAQQQAAWISETGVPSTDQLLDAQLTLCAVLGREILDGALTDIHIQDMAALQAGRPTRLYCGSKSYTALQQRWIWPLSQVFRWHVGEVDTARVGAVMRGGDLTWTAHPAVWHAIQQCRTQLRGRPASNVISLPDLLAFVAWHHLAGGDGRSTLQHAMHLWCQSLDWPGSRREPRPIMTTFRRWQKLQGFRTLAQAAELCGGSAELVTNLAHFDDTPPWQISVGGLTARLAEAGHGDAWEQIRPQLWADHGYAAPAVRLRVFGSVQIPVHVLRAVGRLFPDPAPASVEGLAAGLNHLKWNRILRRARDLLEIPDPATYQPSNGGRYLSMRMLDAAQQVDLGIIAAWALPAQLPAEVRSSYPILPIHGSGQPGSHLNGVMVQVLRAAHDLNREVA